MISCLLEYLRGRRTSPITSCFVLGRTRNVKSRSLQDDGSGRFVLATMMSYVTSVVHLDSLRSLLLNHTGRARFKLLCLGSIAPALILPFSQQKAAPVVAAKAPVTKPAAVGGLQPYVETLPDSLVKVNMIPIPAGS